MRLDFRKHILKCQCAMCPRHILGQHLQSQKKTCIVKMANSLPGELFLTQVRFG